MKVEFVKVVPKLTADTFGCEEAYFKKYIQGKPLMIVHETPNHYVRVTDQNQEEWGLFNHQYTVVTGIGDPKTPDRKEEIKNPMVSEAAP